MIYPTEREREALAATYSSGQCQQHTSSHTVDELWKQMVAHPPPFKATHSHLTYVANWSVAWSRLKQNQQSGLYFFICARWVFFFNIAIPCIVIPTYQPWSAFPRLKTDCKVNTCHNKMTYESASRVRSPVLKYLRQEVFSTILQPTVFLTGDANLLKNGWLPQCKRLGQFHANRTPRHFNSPFCMQAHLWHKQPRSAKAFIAHVGDQVTIRSSWVPGLPLHELDGGPQARPLTLKPKKATRGPNDPLYRAATFT